MSAHYVEPHSLRRALEDRLKAEAAKTRLPHDRLRKEVAFERLLARLAVTAPVGSWALKGGMAMIARAGAHARATADADTTWRADVDDLMATLRRAASTDLADHFEFVIGEPGPLRGEGPAGGLRFPIQARLAGRLFESVRLDVNLSPDDPRPIETLRMRHLLAFTDLPPVVVPAISAAQQLAEKLHAYCRDYGTAGNSRAKDLYDMLIIAADLHMPALGELVDACVDTFARRTTPWPPLLRPPPPSWARPWAGFVRDYGIVFTTLPEADAAITAFWQPVLDASDRQLVWSSDSWSWA